MNLYSNSPLMQNGQTTFFTKFVMTKLIVLLLAVSLYARPAPAQGLFLIALTLAPLIIIDHNSCWVNLIWGCDDNDGAGGAGGGSATLINGTTGETIVQGTYTYESNFPPADDPNGLVPVGGLGGGTRDSIDSKPCTQGTTCPGDELGVVVIKNSIQVSPAFANSKTNTCPLFWTPGKENSQSIVSCQLISNGVATALPKDGSNKNTFQIPVGRHVLSCTRTTTEIVTQYGTKPGETAKTKIKEQTNVFTTIEDHNVRCNAIPNVNEI